jgi:hypothetical protein
MTMFSRPFGLGGLVLLLAAWPATLWAQDPEAPAALPAQALALPASSPLSDPPPAAVPEHPYAHHTPFMIGDFIGPIANLFSDVKIAEDESPRPEDRVFFKFNYYNNLDPSRFRRETASIHDVDLYRNTFGFEKTFFDSRASLGVRLPFNTIDAEGRPFVLNPTPGGPVLPGESGFTTTQFGNISSILKGVLWEDAESGSLLSAGATLSFPTASSKKINPGQSVLAYAQPFVGFILSRGDFFIQGFSSLTLPVAHVESVVLFNDLGVGYYLYKASPQTSLLTAVAPMFEVHIASPLHQADPTASVFGFTDALKLHNVVDLTLGTALELAGRASLNLGVAVPITGPRPFDFEVIAQLNFGF